MKKRDILVYAAIAIFLSLIGYSTLTGNTILLQDEIPFCVDSDGDGYNSTSNCGTIDFDDNDKFLFPNAPEWCDGKDNNNDGKVDYITTQGDLCPIKDCYSDICSFGRTFSVIWNQTQYDEINKFDLYLSNAQNAFQGVNFNTKFITHRTFIESSNLTSNLYHGWETITLNEDWFHHDASGNRLINSEYPTLLLMNISNPVYRNFKYNETAIISTFTGLDGWFYDNYVDYSSYSNYLDRNFEVSASSYFSSQSQYENLMKDSAYSLKKRLGNKLFIANDHAYSGYSDYFDGYMAEGWVHPSHATGWPTWLTESLWLQDIQLAQQSAHNNKILILNCDDNSNFLNYSIFNFCFSSYLLAKEQGAKTFFGYIYSDKLDYPEEFDLNLGSPTNDYYIQDNLYQRDFENGKVIVNVKEPRQTRTLNLSGSYTNISGSSLSQITLKDHEAIILLTQENSETQTNQGTNGGSSGGGGSSSGSTTNTQTNIPENLEMNEQGEVLIELIQTNYKETSMFIGEYILQLVNGVNHSFELNEINEEYILVNIDGRVYELFKSSPQTVNLDGFSLTLTYLEMSQDKANIIFKKEVLTIIPEFKYYYILFAAILGFVLILIIIVSLLKYQKEKMLNE